MMFETYVCRLDVKPPVDGYGETVGKAKDDARARAIKAGHQLVRRGLVWYVLEP